MNLATLPDPMSVSTDRVTTILLDAEGGSRATLDRLFPVVYDDLRAIAHRQLSAEHAADTLSTTALVHEAYIRLADSTRVTARGRAYFFAAAAHAMRRIVVEYARRRRRLKRGGGVKCIPLDEALVPSAGSEVDVLDLERGLAELTGIAERAAIVVECRFFAGLTVEDTAVALGVTGRTVKRDWAFARAWLFDYMGSARPETDP